MSVMIIEDYWSKSDYENGQPFTSGTHKMFRGWLRDAGINPDHCHFTHTFNQYPPYGNENNFFTPDKRLAIPGYPQMDKKAYILNTYKEELDRLFFEINTVKPWLVITLGKFPLWATAHITKVKTVRGTILPGDTGKHKYKIAPIYNPKSIIKDWGSRLIILCDLAKAKKESEFPEIRRISREIWIQPTFQDLETYYKQYIKDATSLSVDIETKGEQISCVGFAPSTTSAIVVPFYSETSPGKNYWKSLEEEKLVWRWVKNVLQEKREIIGQNFLFDAGFLWRKYGIPVPNEVHDTMLMHHAYMIEMEKGLGFLASIYAEESAWKFRGKRSSLKDTLV